MIARYTREEMGKIFSDENKFKNFLKVEEAVVHYLSEKGVVPKKDYETIVKNACYNVDEIAVLEKETKHDVIAFTRNVSSSLKEEKKWIHYGLTSTDVVDTALSLSYKEANLILVQDLIAFKDALTKKALEYKMTPCIGRTHGIHADITSFGLKWALYVDELNRDYERFLLASKEMQVAKISGAVGTFSILPIECQDFVADELGLNSSLISTQILQRDRHAFYASTIALIGGLIEKIATEIRNLQRTEIHEVEEAFSVNQKGSSAMPHKHNPIGSENMCGCSRLLRGYMVSIYEDMALYHERDISHSSVERVALVDAITLLDYMLNRMTNIINTLNVYPSRMLKNISITNNVIYSQYVLTLLINKGLSREKAYDLIQPLAVKAYEEDKDFFLLLKENNEFNKLVEPIELDELKEKTFKNIPLDEIYHRVGIY